MANGDQAPHAAAGMAMPAAAIAGDARFFNRGGPFGVAAIAAAAGGTAAEDDGRSLSGMAQLQVAGAAHVSFLDNRRYADALAATQAGCVLVHPDMHHRVPDGCLAIVMTEPRVGWARVAVLFHPPAPMSPGIHPNAWVDPSASVDATAEIDPFATIGAGAEIGPRCRIGAGAVIGPGVVLGPDCRIGPQASLSHTLVGARVYVYPGARIGQEGFGFEITPAGMLSVPQLGRVILEDDVEVGANSTIDRGSIGDTVIGAGSRLDNLVQIGHNVRLGRCCVVVSQVGISGSTVVEDFVMFGGQAGITGHLRIGRGAKIGAQAGVMADVPAGASVVGSPAVPFRDAFRQFAVVKKLAARSAAGTSNSDTGKADPAKTGMD